VLVLFKASILTVIESQTLLYSDDILQFQHCFWYEDWGLTFPLRVHPLERI